MEVAATDSPKKIKKEYLALVILTLLVIVFYGNTLENGFIYDDSQQVIDNIYIRSLKFLPKVISGCTWESAFGGCKDRAIYYRPIQSLSYLLTYQISPQPWVFHLVNLFYFLAIVYLVFLLAQTLTDNFLFSFLSAFLFLIHPVNSETVSWIASVPELTFAVFVLLSTIFYLKYRQTNLIKKLWLSALFYFLALLSKEPAILLPVIFIFIDIILFNLKPENYLEWEKLRDYLIFGGLAILYLIMRLAVLGHIFSQGKSPYAPVSWLERVYSFFILFSRYLKKFFLPEPLVFFHFFEKRTNFFNPSFLAGFGAVFLFFLAVIFAFKKKKNLLLFSFAWIFLFLLPVMVFIEAAGESVFSERYLFVPGIGFSLAVSYIISYFWQKEKKMRIWLFLFLIIALIISVNSVLRRSQYWHDNEKMYTKTLSQNPDATPIRFNYAVLLRNEKRDFAAAKAQFEEIIRRKPNWGDMPLIYLHLGDYYQEVGNEQKALEYYHQSVSFSDDWKTNFAYDRLGVFYAKKENYLMALIYFCQAVQINPDSKDNQAHFNQVISLIDFNYGSNPTRLYQEISEGKSFSRSAKEGIQFVDKVCQERTCSFLFSPRFEANEVILPFLIVAANEKKEGIKIENPVFNPQINQVIINLDGRYEKDIITFVFPTCEGVYYEASTP